LGSNALEGLSLDDDKPYMDVEPPMGARRDAKQVGGESQPEKRHDLTAAVLRIGRRRKNPVRRVSVTIFVPGIFQGRRLVPSFYQPFP
jgi:hypothetical protein